MSTILADTQLLPSDAPVDGGLFEALDRRAHLLHAGDCDVDVAHSLQLLAQGAYLGQGISPSIGGAGEPLNDAVEAIAAVSAHCLTSGFIFWCQRAFAGYLAATSNQNLRDELLPRVLSAEVSGATGLSNAMKHLAGIEKLGLQFHADAESVTLNGKLPWASNLRPGKFVIAVAAQNAEGEKIIVAVPAHAAGVSRGEDFNLLGLQASWTSSIQFDNVRLPRHWVIDNDAAQFLPRIRPTFVLLQCGLALGVSRRALDEASACTTGGRHVLQPRLHELREQLHQSQRTISELAKAADDTALNGTALDSDSLSQIFKFRIAVTGIACEAVRLELEARGGRAYFRDSGTARRLQEVMFLPVLTPSLVQLQTELERHDRSRISATEASVA